MARDKHSNKKHHNNHATNNNDKKNERPKSRLFNEIDAQGAEPSYDTVTHGYHAADPLVQERLMPLGVVEIDESVKFPNPSPKSDHHNHDSKSYNSVRSNEKHTERVYLPTVSQRQYPYGNSYPSYDYYHVGHLPYLYPNYHEPYQNYYHQDHHRHHHHRHHHHHHKHKKEIETYDPRWWYMPVNSVHAPKQERPYEQHFAPPKWYESPNKPIRILTNKHDTKHSSSSKYSDCRCEACRPTKKAPHGSRWVVNE